MLADPRHSQLVLINPARCVLGKRPAGFAARWHESLSLLPHVMDIFDLGIHAAGSFDPGLLPVSLADAVTVLDTDGLSLWEDERFTAHLSAAGMALHGVVSTTVRQAMLEWAVCFEDPVVTQKVQQLLAQGADGLS